MKYLSRKKKKIIREKKEGTDKEDYSKKGNY